MELSHQELTAEGEGEGEEIDREFTTHANIPDNAYNYSGGVRRKAYMFDGEGNYFDKEWDLSEGSGKEFCWYHVELPKWNQKLSQSARYLIDVLCPPLNLQDILSLVSNGPFCAHVNSALVLRVNSPGPASSNFTFRIAARVTENLVITVSLGRVPRLGFSPVKESLLSEIPIVESPSYSEQRGRSGTVIREHVLDSEQRGRSGTVIREHVLDFLLTKNHFEEADNPVPKSVSNLVVHILDRHVDHVQDIVTKLEIELDSVELELDKGCFALKQQMLEDRRFPKVHLDSQRLLQVIAYGEQVIPRVKEKCCSKDWFASDDINTLEELSGQLKCLKESVGFIANRVTGIQAGLESWQADQITAKLYNLSFLSIMFLPLSVVTGVFGMNVGGVPWTNQNEPELKDGFHNVMFLCVALILLVLLCFLFPDLYTSLLTWKRRRDMKRSWSLNHKSSFRRNTSTNREGYQQLY